MFPLVLDLLVCGAVAYLVASRAHPGPARSAIGAVACVVALLTPVGAVMIATPSWIRAVAVMMMVVGFDALAEVTGAAGTVAAGLDSAARERLWDEFERQFAAYVESGAQGSGTPRRQERAG